MEMKVIALAAQAGQRLHQALSPAPPPLLGRRSRRCTSWGMSQRESSGSTDTSPSWKREALLSQVCLPWARSPWTCSDSTSASKRSGVWPRLIKTRSGVSWQPT
uniref:Alternative protein ARID1B n=1 Tax=Homo sapiens TaxID=9606 RepID=L8EAX2_HUMAN|nr:alternative protein ARID1B [Homo sapiens]